MGSEGNGMKMHETNVYRSVKMRRNAEERTLKRGVARKRPKPTYFQGLFCDEVTKSGTSVMFDKNYVFSNTTRAKGCPFETQDLTLLCDCGITNVIGVLCNGQA